MPTVEDWRRCSPFHGIYTRSTPRLLSPEDECRIYLEHDSLPSRYHDKIETSHDFVRTGYKWGAPQPAWAYSIRLAQAADDLAMFQRFEAHPDEILRNKSFSRNYGIGIERLHAGSYSFGDYVQMDSLQKQDVRITKLWNISLVINHLSIAFRCCVKMCTMTTRMATPYVDGHWWGTSIKSRCKSLLTVCWIAGKRRYS